MIAHTTQHDLSRADTVEDLEGDRLDQLQLQVQKAINDLADKVDFRNKELGEVVKGQNEQHAMTTKNLQSICGAIKQSRSLVTAETTALLNQVIAVKTDRERENSEK